MQSTSTYTNMGKSLEVTETPFQNSWNYMGRSRNYLEQRTVTTPSQKRNLEEDSTSAKTIYIFLFSNQHVLWKKNRKQFKI